VRRQRQQHIGDAEVELRDLGAGEHVPGWRNGRDLADKGNTREILCRRLQGQGGANPLVIALDGVGGEFNCVGGGHAWEGAR